MITILSDNWMNLQWDNTHCRRSFLDCDVISFPIMTSHLLARLSICCAGLHTCMRLALWRTAPGEAGVSPVFLQRSDAVARIPANGSAAFNKSCAPIGKNSSATALCRSSKAGPGPWLVCVMSNATCLGGTVVGIRRYLRSPSPRPWHIAAPGFMPQAPGQSLPPTSFPIFSGNPRQKFRFFTPPRPSADPRPRHFFLKIVFILRPKTHTWE